MDASRNTAGPWVPPLDVALATARRALADADRIDLDSPSAVALDHGSLAMSLRMLADAVDAERREPMPDPAEARRTALLELAGQAHLFMPHAAAPAVREWLTDAARMAPAARIGGAA